MFLGTVTLDLRDESKFGEDRTVNLEILQQFRHGVKELAMSLAFLLLQKIHDHLGFLLS